MKHYPFISLSVVVSLFMIALIIIAAPAPSPVHAGDPTLDAAIGIIIQATRQEQDRRNDIAATRAAIESEAARQRAAAAATSQALSAESTRAAIESTRSAVATRQSIDSTATRAAVEATATAQAVSASSTAQAVSAESTAQAAIAAATATAIRDVEIARTNSERIRSSSLVVLIVIGLAIGAASFRALWRIAPRPAAKPVVIVERAEPPAPLSNADLPPIPITQVVYDQAAAQNISDMLAYQETP